MLKIKKTLTWPLRKYKLERMVSWYIMTCGGNMFSKEARRQAREVILDGPDNPM